MTIPKRTIYRYVNDIINDNVVCCINCMFCTVVENYKGMCKNKSSDYYDVKFDLEWLVKLYLYNKNTTHNRLGGCPFFVNIETGEDNLSVLKECTWCGNKVPYKDMYDKFALFCSKECRQAFNSKYEEIYNTNRINKRNKRLALKY